jgi:molybdopterin converting factor small subunit
MDQNEQRFVELTFRYGLLKEVKDKLEKGLENKVIQMFSKAFDESVEDKQAATITVLNKWMKEIDQELNTLEGKVFVNYMNDIYVTMENKLKENLNQ